ncbi:hypothetical protein RhiirB3_449003 [Rhizophagus irregularis]|nr:hypothetical protein RhiirB3_449003 [Rhizophagus irregularis]
MNIEYTNRNSPIRSNFVQADSDMPIRYPVPSPLDFLVGFLDVGRHLDRSRLGHKTGLYGRVGVRQLKHETGL